MDIEKCKETLELMKAVAIDARVYDRMFLGFGTLLGAIRDNGIIKHDTDMDVCFLPMVNSAKDRYFEMAFEAGLMNGWNRDKTKYLESDRAAKNDLDSFQWFSVKKEPEYPKCCNWFFTPWNEVLWHGKASFWKRNDKLYMKGIPESFFDELISIDFLGIKFHIPRSVGAILDFWYGDWMTPKYDGESDHRMVMTYKTFKDKSSWHF